MIISEEELDEQLEIEERLEEKDIPNHRLYGAVIKSDRWEVELVDDKNYSTYVLKDTKEHYSYTFSQIIGFEQVADNEFLVYVNAETGVEEDILVIINTPNGTLTT